MKELYYADPERHEYSELAYTLLYAIPFAG